MPLSIRNPSSKARAQWPPDEEIARIAIALKALPEYVGTDLNELIDEAYHFLRRCRKRRRALEHQEDLQRTLELRYSPPEAAKLVMDDKNTERAVERFGRFKDFILTLNFEDPLQHYYFKEQFDRVTRNNGYRVSFCEALMK